MKIKTLLFSTLLAGAFSAQAQCVITPSCTPDLTDGYCVTPQNGTALPPATAGASYNFSIQASVGTTAINGAATVYAVIINNVTLPGSLTATTNPTNGGIPGGTSGCIEIAGIPSMADNGSQIIVNATLETNGGNITQNLAWNFIVNPSTVSLIEATSASISIFPNPAVTELNVTVQKPTHIKLIDVLGAELYAAEVQSSEKINIEHLKSGIYFVLNEEDGSAIKWVKN